MKPGPGVLLCLWIGLGAAEAADLLKQGAQLIRQGKQDQALALFRDAAANGDPAGDYALGVMHFEGMGVDQDMIASSRYFLAAARRGHVLAQFNLGNAYVNARGVQFSLDQAEYWWRKAAVSGYVRAQFNLGTLLHENHTRAALREEGIAWYRAAAQGGFPKALNKLQDLDEPLNYADIEADPARQPLRDEARLMTLPGDSHVIQLFSGRKAGSADVFIRDNGLTGHALRFRFPVKDRIWTGVIHGGWYQDAGEAQGMLVKLKASLRDAGPWVRSAHEIQEVIRKLRDAGPTN